MSTAFAEQPNLAPAQKLDENFEQAPPPKSKPFHEWWEAITRPLLADDEALWEDCFNLWELIHHYLNGDFALRKKHRGIGWSKVDVPVTTNNQAAKNFDRLGFYHRQLVARTMLARTQYECRGRSDTDQAQGAARAGAQWLQYLDKTLYTAQFRAAEIYSSHTCGAFARYFTVETGDDGPLARVPKYAGVQAQGAEGYSECLECGAKSEHTPGMAQCASCGSDLMEHEATESSELQQAAGFEEFTAPKVKCTSVPYTQLRHEFRKPLHDSLYVRWARTFRGEELKAAFPKLKLRSAGVEDKGLQAERSMTSVGESDLEAGKIYEGYLWWLDPKMYADYVFPENTPTVDGPVVPAGTRAAELFKTGMVAFWVRGMSQPLFVAEEHHRECWVAGQYRTKLFSGVGLPLKDAIEMAQTYNYLMNLVLKQIATVGLPGWLYDENAISEDYVNLLGRPDANVPVTLEGDRNIDQVIKQMAPGQIPAHIPYFIGATENNLQSSVGALDFGNWAGVKNDTATGAELANSAAAGHLAPELENRAQGDIDSAYLMLKLIKKHVPFEVYLTLKNETGLQDGLWLSGASLDQIVIEAGRDSAETKTLTEERQDYQAAWAMVGGLQGYLFLLHEAPDVLTEIENLYGVNLGGRKHNSARLLARQRVDEITKAVESVLADQQYMTLAVGTSLALNPETGMVEPISLAQIVAQEAHAILAENPDPSQSSLFPVSAYELGLMEAMVWLRQWLTLDEGKGASQALRMAIEMLIKQYVQGLATEGLVTNAVAAFAQVVPQALLGGVAPGAPGTPPASGPAPKPSGGKPSPGRRGRTSQPNLQPSQGGL